MRTNQLPTKILVASTIASAVVIASSLVRQRRKLSTISVYAEQGQVWAGQPIRITWAWEAATQAYCQSYINAATFSFRLDGDPFELGFSLPILTKSGNTVVARWFTDSFYLPKGNHELGLITYLTEAILDGMDQDDDGLLDVVGPGEITTRPCQILVK